MSKKKKKNEDVSEGRHQLMSKEGEGEDGTAARSNRCSLWTRKGFGVGKDIAD